MISVIDIWISLLIICPVDRVVGTSNFQIASPDALFVVFLGIKWAYDFTNKNRSGIHGYIWA